jgi:trigger factor
MGIPHPGGTRLKIDIETPAEWSRRLTITVPADRVARERRAVAAQIAKRVKLPGFRKGKVPASVLEKQYGPSIEQQTLERVVNSAYREALREQGFSPISEASVDNVSYEPGADLSFDVAFEVRPDIELARLGGFTIQAPSVAVDEADVDRVMERLREQNATWNPLEEATPTVGDRVRVEITPLHAEDGDEPEPRTYEVVLGAGEILESIEAAIQTLAPGDEGEFAVDLPESTDGEKEHRIRLKLLAAERPELPELDDAFAKELGDFESLDDLRSRVREDLAAEAQRESDRDVRRQLMQQVLEANAFEVPPSLVEQYLDSLLQAPEGTEPAELEQAKEQARPAAEYGVRRMLAIERIAELEGLHATQEDVDARVQEIAEENRVEPAVVRRELMRSGRLQAIASDLTEKRVFDYLKSLNTIITEGA